MNILAIESSCDETAAAVVEDGRVVRSSVVATQIEEHKLYGGVVPEIASRRHAEAISQVAGEALEQADLNMDAIGAVAVTYAPGLIGALLVGVNFAKGLALSAGKPLVPVHHLRSHVAANYLQFPELEPPFLCLVVSGGHSHIVRVEDYTRFHIVGRTRDDAAGEVLDKVGRSLGLPYPGGVHMDRVAAGGDKHAYAFPNPKVEGAPFDFSFSGLKTHAVNLIHNTAQKGECIKPEDFAASFQNAVVTSLTGRLERAAREQGAKRIALAGGVAANSLLRAETEALCRRNGWELFVPPLSLCGDNAAMVGAQGFYEFQAGSLAQSGLNAYATMPIDAPSW
ncbi:MAG: tRNA (adenosine(37)-N6)-threonylcarbamoyltransferase complex transferase subunit TsaD [Clostridiales bacterium]|nr:tRNA (adenosine(37)-N6)-threonylcarbamoyltransferase complex transferase subunit TsaD [Clostridiales bacterium]